MDAMAVAQELTELKAAEARLRGAHNRLESILQTVGEAHALLDHGWRYLYINDIAQSVIGRPRDQVMGQTLWDIHPGLAGTEVEMHCRLVMSERVPSSLCAHDPNTKRWWDIRMFPVSEGIALFATDITDRKLAEIALHESESRYRDLVEHSSDLICTHDSQGMLLSINEAPLRVLGYTREEMLNRPLREFVTDEAKAKCDEYLAQVQKDGVARGLLPVLTKKGEVRLWEYNNSVRMDGVSLPIVRAIAHDVTEQKRAESALRRSEEKFSKAFRLSPVEMVITTLEEGRFVEVNGTFEQNLGFRRDEVIGRTTLELGLWVNPADRKRIVEEIRNKNRVVNQEVQIRGKSGEARFKLYSAESITIEGQKCLLAVSEDIEDRKRAETKLFRSQVFLSEAQRLTHTGSWAWTPESGELMWSMETFRIFGLDPAETKLSVELFLQCVHPEDRPRVEDTVKRALAEGCNFELEYRTVLADKSVKFIHSVGRPVLNTSGELLQFMGTAVDVTERKQVEAQLQKLSAQLLQLHDEERRTLSREIHDTTGQELIALKATLALLQPAIPKSNRKLRKQLKASMMLASKCISDLRTLSYVLYPSMLDETGLGDAIGHYVDGFSERTGITVSLDVPPDFGRLPRGVEVVCFRIMQESLCNVHRHSGSSVANVRLTRDCGTVSMEISDTGHGIPGYMCGKEQSGPKAGVGIPVMHERVRQIGGQLEIDSGKSGTTVRLVIPINETSQ